MSFTVTVKDDEVRQTLIALQQRLTNIQPAMQGIGKTIMNRPSDALTPAPPQMAQRETVTGFGMSQ